MKRHILCFAVAVVFSLCGFSATGYYIDEFPNNSYIAQDLTKTYEYKNGNRKSYVVYECEAILCSQKGSGYVKDSRKKIILPAGTQIEILSVDSELKISHSFDKNPWDNDNPEEENKGVIYFDYVCNFTLNEKSYTGYVLGIYVSTNNETVITDDGIRYILMSIWVIPSLRVYDRLCDSKDFNEVAARIKEIQNSDIIFEGMGLSEKSRYLLSSRIINTATKNISDIKLYQEKFMDFKGKGYMTIKYERNLPEKTIILECKNYNGGMGGGGFEYTWFTLNPETGNTYLIFQCAYINAEIRSGSHTVTFNSKGATLKVEEYDEDGNTLQNETVTYGQKSKLLFENMAFWNPEDITDSKFNETPPYFNYYTTENLRLRKEPNMSSETIIVLKKRFPVCVHEIGKKETIDGITSNWVQVTVKYQKDGDDTGTIYALEGWCFGGYLSFY